MKVFTVIRNGDIITIFVDGFVYILSPSIFHILKIQVKTRIFRWLRPLQNFETQTFIPASTTWYAWYNLHYITVCSSTKLWNCWCIPSTVGLWIALFSLQEEIEASDVRWVMCVWVPEQDIVNKRSTFNLYGSCVNDHSPCSTNKDYEEVSITFP